MTYLEKFYEYASGKNKDVFKDEAIVFEILNDMTDRREFRHTFDQSDDEIKEEIIQTWLNIVKTKLN